jgi:glycosyltransferase involved in cell wall biosynthesis
LVNFFDHAALLNAVCDLLDQPQERQRLGANARQFAQQHYDLHSVCLPRQIQWVNTWLP